MLMSVIEEAQSALMYPDLAGKRVLITGLSSRQGVDIARGFAEHRARLILQFAETSEKTQAIAEIVAPAALDIEVFGPLGGDTDDVVQFARSAVQAFGSLDAVINLVPLADIHLDPCASEAEVERLVAGRLLLPCLLSKIAANRMAMTLTQGLILNIATLALPFDRAAHAFASVMKAALAAMTRSQAEEWALKGIRFNAVAPQTVLAPASLSGEPNIAALALYLASSRGRELSGHVFEAEAIR